VEQVAVHGEADQLLPCAELVLAGARQQARLDELRV
jgi:hypothetical protein